MWFPPRKSTALKQFSITKADNVFMRETVNPQEARAAIEQRVESLAMQLLMNDEKNAESGQWSEALMSLSEAAAASGQQDIAALAREVAGQIATSGKDSNSARQCFEGGILRLQEVLLSAQKPAASPQAERPMKLSLDRELIGDFVM